jgi:dTDP-4-amino-4,6-dideoxygalactose transaminase
MTNFLPFAMPDIGEAEIEEVCRTLRSGWLTTGPKTKRFEAEFASYVGTRHALAVNSATAGMHLALEAIGVSTGDKVVTSINTFTSTAEVIRYFGADPVFVDIDARTLNMDVEKVGEAVTADPSIKAIMPVHIAGQSCDMNSVAEIADAAGCRLIEDAAHALPTSYQGRMVGTISDATVFSFYATKTLSTGEGGMVVTNDDRIASRIRTMRMHGIDRDVYSRYQTDRPIWYYEVVAPGFKYNMPDIAAAIGIHQLARLQEMRDRRQEIADHYLESFADLPVRLPIPVNADDVHAWHLFIMQLNLDELDIDRNRFVELMSDCSIGTSVHFIPLHYQPYWRDTYSLLADDFPIASAAFKRVVSLPIYSKMADTDVERVVAATRTK